MVAAGIDRGYRCPRGLRRGCRDQGKISELRRTLYYQPGPPWWQPGSGGHCQLPATARGD
jgi:hypothetical protein